MDERKRSEIELRLAEALIAFVERVTEKHATPEEMAALPGVACVLKDISSSIPEVRTMDEKKPGEIESRPAETLIAFEERAAEERATPEEVEALPDVARMIKDAGSSITNVREMGIKEKTPNEKKKNYKVIYDGDEPLAVEFDGIQVMTTHGTSWQCELTASGSRCMAVVSFIVSLVSIALNIYLLCA